MLSRENTLVASPKLTTLLALMPKSARHTYLDASTVIDGTLHSRYTSPTVHFFLSFQLPTDGGDFRVILSFHGGKRRGVSCADASALAELVAPHDGEKYAGCFRQYCAQGQAGYVRDNVHRLPMMLS
ncbi:hypothetical protein C8R44DRAFT_882292 [Mycena epipterygia]|nr:hypothetical protein C8R44DRAFT_882292 [Mycena epipterygia]